MFSSTPLVLTIAADYMKEARAPGGIGEELKLNSAALDLMKPWVEHYASNFRNESAVRRHKIIRQEIDYVVLSCRRTNVKSTRYPQWRRLLVSTTSLWSVLFV